MAKKKTSNRRIWGIIILVFGLIFATIGGGLTYVAYDFSTRAIATSGVVTNIEVNLPSSTNSGGTGGPTYKPTLRYIDQNGRPQSGQTFLSSSSYNYAIGTKINILYDPANPGSLRMDSWFSLWGFNLVFLVTGLLIMAGGAALWRYGGQKPAQAKATDAAPSAQKTDFSYSSRDKPQSPTVRRK